MTDRPARDPLDDFAWHPDPELAWYLDPARSRESAEALGATAWEVALDWLYDEGFRRPTGPMGYAELRRLWYGMPADAPASSVGPGPAPADPVPASAVPDEFRARLSEHQFSSVHPLSWSYFTAYGGGALLSERDAGRIGPLGRVDSVTIDPHKWFFQPYDVGALLVRRHDDLRDTFHRAPEYYRTPGNEEEPLNFYQLSIEGSRRLRALELWMSWKHLGTRGLGRLVERNDDLAARLAALVARSDDFEATPPEPELSVVCFRWLPGGRTAAAGLDPTTLDEVQDGLQRALEVSGEGWVSTTRLRGSTWLRAGIVNYLSTDEDADRMLAILRRLGPGVAEEMGL